MADRRRSIEPKPKPQEWVHHYEPRSDKPFAGHPHADENGAMPWPLTITDADGREIYNSKPDPNTEMPRARDVPELRERLAADWAPDGSLSRVMPTLRAASGGQQHYIPSWERETAQKASLWYVGPDMCDLLETAAPTIPPTRLIWDLVPDSEGLVVFARPLLGIDAMGNDDNDPVPVWAITWGRARFEDVGLGLGISNYQLRNGRLLPIGTVAWPLGENVTWRPEGLSDRAAASMTEDRQRLLALWLLSSQPGVATSTTKRPTNRQTARRLTLGGLRPLRAGGVATQPTTGQ